MAASNNSQSGAEGYSDSGHHITPLSTYAKVLAALLVLTILTVAVARPVSGFDAGILNAAIAFIIATIKASLVLAIFMGLKYEKKKLNLAIFLTGVFCLLILLVVSVVDMMTRIHYTSPL